MRFEGKVYDEIAEGFRQAKALHPEGGEALAFLLEVVLGSLRVENPRMNEARFRDKATPGGARRDGKRGG